MGLGLSAFAEAGDRRTGLLEVLANMAVAGTVAEDRQVAHGDARQPGILRRPESSPGPFTELLGGGSRKRPVQLIGLCQKPNILQSRAAAKPLDGALPTVELPGLA